MSETSYLGLFKHDNPATNTNKFDIETALNENWDKIDENAFSTHEETNIDMQTDTAKELEITDSANAIASFNKVEGDTYQDTYTGKNLFNKNGNLVLDNRLNTVGGATSAEGQYISEYIPVTAGVTYTKNSPTEDAYHRICFYSSNETTSFISASNDNTNEAPTGATYVRFCGMQEELDTTQFEASSSATAYEPYVGGKASPSPDYPSDIRNVGDNINLINLKNITRTVNGVTFTVNSDNSITAIGTATANATFYLNTSDNTSSYSENINIGNYILNGCNDGSNSTYQLSLVLGTADTVTGIRYFNNRVQPINININNNNVYYIALTVYSGVTINKTFYPKLEKGLIVTPYTPYNCGSIDIKVQNKNLFAGWKRNQRVDPTTGAISISNNYLSSDFCNVKPNTNYYLSGVVIGDYSKNKFVSFYDINKNYISRSQSLNISNLQFTTPVNAYYCIFCINGSFADSTTMENFINDCSEIQIEKGNTATLYVPHQEQDIQFPLASGQLLHKDDFLADDGIHQTKKTLICKGEEGWSANATSSSTGGKIRWRLALTDIKSTDGSVVANIKCSDYSAVTAGQTYMAVQGIAVQNQNITIYDENYGTSSITDWNNYLATKYSNGTPVIIEYELAEETITPYTTEQQEAYYKLKHFLTYEGYTLIECIDNIKPDIQANYLYNNKVNNYYGNIIYELENRLHQLEIS